MLALSGKCDAGMIPGMADDAEGESLVGRRLVMERFKCARGFPLGDSCLRPIPGKSLTGRMTGRPARTGLPESSLHKRQRLTRCARRFWAQALSLLPMTKGRSLP